MKKKYYLIIALSTVFLSSCALAGIALGVTGNLTVSSAEEFKVDITNAKAIAGVEGDRSLTRSGYRLTEEDDAKLVKFLDDGTISSILDFGTDSWTPDISFMSIGDDGSVYVCFQYSYSFGGGINSSGTRIQFIRIYPNSTEYDILWPIDLGADATSQNYNDLGEVNVWNYEWMDQDPMVKGPNGELYFSVYSYGYNGTSENSIYKYDPNTGSAPEKVTPDAPISFSYFYVDSNGNLIIQSDDYDDNGSSLKYYTPGGTGYTNIYYSTENNTWVRGITCSPDDNFIIINGQNIRGMSGLIKVTINGKDDFDCDYLYPSISNSSYYDLYRYSNSSYDTDTELAIGDYGSLEWLPEVLNDTESAVDKDKILERVKLYFWDYDTVTIGSALETYLTNNPLTLDSELTLTTDQGNITNKLWNWLYRYSSDFLKYGFNGTLTYDYVTANNLNDINFDNFGTLQWASDGSLYALHDGYYWGGSDNGTSVVKILDSNGNKTLSKMELGHSSEKANDIKIIGDELYYTYAVFDSFGQETGIRKLARMNVITGTQKDLTPSSMPELEILSYDVADSNDFYYLVGINPQTNEVHNCRVDINSMTVTSLDNSTRFSSIKVIE